MDILNQIMSKAHKYINSEHLQDFQNDLILILSDYNITTSSKELMAIDTDDIKFLRMYLAILQVEGKTERTIKFYKSQLELLKKRLGGKNLLEVTTNDVRYCVAHGLTELKWSVNTANNFIRTTATFYNWLVREDILNKNPYSKIKKVKGLTEPRKGLTDEEIEKIKSYIETIKKDEERLRNRAMFEFFLSTGCRVGEVANLEVIDIDFQNRKAEVIGKGNKKRTVYLTERAKYHLEEYLKIKTVNSEGLFSALHAPNRKLNTSGIEIIIREMGRAVGIKVFPHLLRHTFATKAVGYGIPLEQVSKMMGHEQLDTTMIYAKHNDEELRYSHNKYMR